MRTLDNNIIKVSLNQEWGGAITEISHGGFNLINSPDTGRCVQAALYSGDVEDIGSPDNWNPVQGGNRLNKGSGMISVFEGSENVCGKEFDSLFFVDDPLFWNEEYGNVAKLIFATKVSLCREWPLIRLQYLIINYGEDPQKEWRQELPCVFVNDRLKHFWSDINGVDVIVLAPEYPQHSRVLNKGNWIHASVDIKNKFGITLYKPGVDYFYNSFHNTLDTPPAFYMGADEIKAIPAPLNTIKSEAWLIVGNLSDCRNLVGYLREQAEQ